MQFLKNLFKSKSVSDPMKTRLCNVKSYRRTTSNRVIEIVFAGTPFQLLGLPCAAEDAHTFTCVTSGALAEVRFIGYLDEPWPKSEGPVTTARFRYLGNVSISDKHSVLSAA